MVSPILAEKAALYCRLLGKRGVTVRRTSDAPIAAFVIERRVALLHKDRDSDPFERYLGLGVVRA